MRIEMVSKWFNKLLNWNFQLSREYHKHNWTRNNKHQFCKQLHAWAIQGC